jgi:hypothetical protein
MTQQTAVEWMIKEIESLITIETFEKWKAIKEQAKAMDKQQKIDAANWGTLYSDSNKSAEQYYTETYGNP